MATVAAPQPPAVEPNRVVLREVAWETYCQLRDEPENDSIRMTYLNGELTLMSPALRHDQGSRWLFLLVAAVAEASQVEFEPIGTTTLRRQGRAPRRGVGKEADEGFYFGAAAVQISDNDEIDLRVDPPPSLAIEVDHTGDSSGALAADARIGVPEVWRYGPGKPFLWFGRLVGTRYEAIDRSLGLPRLTPALVLEALAARYQEGGMGTLAWTTWLRAWAAALPMP